MIENDFFDFIIAPLKRENFFNDFFEHAPCHIKRAVPGYFDELITRKEIFDFLAIKGNSYPNIQVVKNGQEMLISDYSSNKVIKDRYHFNNVVDPASLYKLFLKDGCSIVVFHAYRHMRTIANCCEKLESLWRCPIQANIYLTPPNSRGFGIHYDNHDVLALQISGKKHWKIFNEPYALPYKNEKDDPQKFAHKVSDLKPIFDQSISDGDLLYIPRGFVHEVNTLDEASIHITFGIHHKKGLDLANDTIESMKNTHILRQSVSSMKLASTNIESYKSELIELFKEALNDEIDKIQMTSSSQSQSEERIDFENRFSN